MPLFAIPFPAFDPIVFSVGPFAIRWYALAYIAGILGAWWLARRIAENQKLWDGHSPIKAADVDDVITWCALGIVLGGRLGYVLFYGKSYFFEHPLEIFVLWHGGMSFHGGFLGTIVALLLYARNHKISMLSMLDLGAIVTPIGLFLGRIANFVNGELWGRVTDVPWGIVFPNAGPLPRHPSQLYEAGLEGIVLFSIGMIVAYSGGLKRPGLIGGLFVACYGLARVAGEQFREPDAQLGFFAHGLTMGTILSLPMIIAGAIAIVCAFRAAPPKGMNAFEREIRAIIEAEGPMPVSRYMALCLSDPRHGYYTTRDPIGAAGDFTTAPEISQMFGELIGLWCAEVWRAMGEPKQVHLAELGPGRGTLMKDLLRAAKVAPDFLAAIDVHLVETSPTLTERQKQTLVESGKRVFWHANTNALPDGPLIVVANEFVDALPIDQFVKTKEGWRERRIGIVDGKLAFGIDPAIVPGIDESLPPRLRKAFVDSILEQRDHTPIREIAERVKKFGGAALIVDYGPRRTTLAHTLQAVRAHEFADPLELPGETDLTSLVDFEALAATAKKAGTKPYGPIAQGVFLRRLGIEPRAERLKQKADAKTRADIDAALHRLVGEAPRQMGELFKAFTFAHANLPSPPGFDS